ncbi:hypothetical protein EHW66_06945 [Erwinia psidii]|uniref:hypothetical protein n=1 Tax=Erwinia psidii TaxID=69224 RepID=UPI00226B2A85|nr:hypothetical protein [Erwinia psidii]MCX8959813.1 hypothetical protein [Erwinia psidii]MCX8964757.1 hypothetical protein [Erwinia psidii]
MLSGFNPDSHKDYALLCGYGAFFAIPFTYFSPPWAIFDARNAIFGSVQQTEVASSILNFRAVNSCSQPFILQSR